VNKIKFVPPSVCKECYLSLDNILIHGLILWDIFLGVALLPEGDRQIRLFLSLMTEPATGKRGEI
jgi:hypothetical protein